MNIIQGRIIQLIMMLLVSVLGVHAFGAKKYIVKYSSQFEFEKMVNEFYQAPIHGLNNTNDGSFRLINSEGIAVETVLDHLGMAVVVVKDVNSEETLKNSFLFSNIEADVLFPGPTPSATFGSRKSKRFSSEKLDLPWGINAVKAPAAWEYTSGEYVSVLVIDTGLDKDHIDLTKRFKMGKNFLPRRPTDPAPYDFFDDIGHGTHVAGTILAGGRDGGLRGVAPRSNLYAARVCGSFGCSSIAIIQALNWGVENKVDVINLSLGGPGRGSRTAPLAYRTAVESGITIVAASGNSAAGDSYKPGTISFPAAYDITIAAGSVNDKLKRSSFSEYGKALTVSAPGEGINSVLPTGTGRESIVTISIDGIVERIESKAFQGSLDNTEIITGSLVYAGLGKPEDFVGLDLKGKFALISRGEITFGKKVSEAIKYGVSGVLIYNNEDGLINGSLTQDGSQLNIPVAMVHKEFGEKILKKLITDKEISTSISVKRTNYGNLSGTSMASPHVAGVVALIKSANPTLTPQQIREILTSTAKDLGNSFETGAGLVNAEKAVIKALNVKRSGSIF